MTTKICSKCNKEYPATAEYFYKNRNYPDNLSKSCIQCDLERMRITRYNKNKEKYNQISIFFSFFLQQNQRSSNCLRSLLKYSGRGASTSIYFPVEG